MKKIAVVNRTNLKNYGSVLQCYALCEAVKELGYESEIIWEQGNVSKNYDFRPKKMFMTALKMLTHPTLCVSVIKSMREVHTKPVSEAQAKKFDLFVENHINQRLFPSKILLQMGKKNEYEKFICGSDQVWCSTTLYVDPLMYLRFVPEKKRIAYAPSIGRNYIPNYNRAQMKKYINEIPFVSIREDDGRKLVKVLTGRDVPVVLDPTLLLRKENWEELAYSEVSGQKKYAVLYFLDEPSESNQKKIAKFLKDFQLNVYSIGKEVSIIEKIVVVKNPICGPNDFLGLIQNAEIVITDSYHGMLFSMIFERNFWSVERSYQQYDQSSRQMTILKKLKLENRYIKNCADISQQEVDYIDVNHTLDKLRRESISYLKTAIEG